MNLSKVMTVGMPVPASLIDPLTVGDTGGICLMSQTGEYLAVSDPNLHLNPALAESWLPNVDGSVWTFKIRRGVKFHDGHTLTARDVVATMDRLAGSEERLHRLVGLRRHPLEGRSARAR